MGLRPPATGAEAYLEAILEELRAIRGLLEDGQPAVGPAAVDAPTHGDPQAAVTVPPAKRTRTRPPRAGS